MGFFLFYPLKDIFLFTGNFSNLVLCIAIKIQQFKIKRSWFASYYELRRSLRLSLLSFTDLSLRRCSDIPDRISNSHICVQRTSWENTSLEASLLFFPTLITWGHLWKSRCFQRPCTSYLRFQKGYFCEYCQAFSLGFLNNNKLRKSQLLIMPCRLQDSQRHV